MVPSRGESILVYEPESNSWAEEPGFPGYPEMGRTRAFAHGGRLVVFQENGAAFWRTSDGGRGSSHVPAHPLPSYELLSAPSCRRLPPPRLTCNCIRTPRPSVAAGLGPGHPGCRSARRRSALPSTAFVPGTAGRADGRVERACWAVARPRRSGPTGYYRYLPRGRANPTPSPPLKHHTSHLIRPRSRSCTSFVELDRRDRPPR